MTQDPTGRAPSDVSSLRLCDGADAIRPLVQSGITMPRGGRQDRRWKRLRGQTDRDPAASRRGDDHYAVVVADRRQQPALCVIALGSFDQLRAINHRSKMTLGIEPMSRVL
jgi:hypothetical protein